MPAANIFDELEQTAHMTDAEAVRRAFDTRNAVMVAIFATLFAVFDLGMLGYSIASKRAPAFGWLVALVALALSIAMSWTMIQLTRSTPSQLLDPAVRSISRSLSDWIVGYFLLQFTAFSWIGGRQGTAVWGTMIPWLIVGLRFSLQRRLAIHIALYAVTIGMTFLTAPNPGDHDLVAAGAIHAAAFGIGAFNSRRVRRRTIAAWTERRASAREQLRMRDELRYARELQLSMLPEEAPKLDWADISGISIPATEVGGDYYDYIDADGCLAVICGDVAGHGMASGITLSALRGGLTLLRHSLRNPANVLERLHEVVTESSRRRILVTIAAVLFDPEKKRATIANAGHPPVLVRRASGLVESIELFGSPLGVRRSHPVPQREIAFDVGDVFVMHTDGIYEAANGNGDSYGLERLVQLLVSTDGSAMEVRDAVLRSVEQFRSSAPQQDDVTIVVVKITEPGRKSDQS